MNRLILAAVIGSLPLAAEQPGTAFQYVFTSTDGPGGKVFRFEAGRAKAVTGRPLSATEEHHTLQVLADGTRIESKSADRFYRDDRGRTRVEREDGTILIDDPVSGASAGIRNGQATSRTAFAFTSGNAEMVSRTEGTSTGYAFTASGPGAPEAKLKDEAAARSSGSAQADKQKAEALAKSESRKEEDLGYQPVNGVSAQGSRTTTTIPVGQIGNDRPIQIVSERWMSPDLQMLIKSTTNDPRFGETTYELTNIRQGAQDPSLFQIPANK
jgi:hypothetical protein